MFVFYLFGTSVVTMGLRSHGIVNNLGNVAIIGGGPAGPSFAASLHDTHYRIVLIDKLDELTLADPPHNGRRCERARRRATLPLYLATDAIVRLYTDNLPLGPACPRRAPTNSEPNASYRAAPTQSLMRERNP